MKRRNRYNPKRQIRETVDATQCAELLQRVRYIGHPEHKQNPGDFGLIPPAFPRPDKTLCDAVSLFTRREATQLLFCGIRKGFISVQMRGEYPQNIWAVSEEGFAFEAQLDNAELGSYHGYPLPASDPFRDHLLKRWSDGT